MTRVALANCSKRFGERVALRRVTLGVASGDCVALVGANGSGKSTLLRVVCGLVRPSAGQALVDDVPSHALAARSRGRIGYVAHRAMAYRGLSGRENLLLVARLWGVAPTAVDDALDAVELRARGLDRIETYSRGMLQRLALARIVLARPALVLLDEPQTGLDDSGLRMLDTIISQRRGHATIILTSHDRAFTARHADRVVTLDNGSLAA